MSFISKLKLGAGAVKLVLKTHAPEILLTVGLASGVATVITACKQTTKLSEIIDDTNEELAEADKALNGEVKRKEGTTYTKEEHDKDVTIIRAHAAGRIARNYALPTGLGVLSVFCILASFRIMHKRNVALATAFNGVSAAFAKYRERVRSELGDDMDRHFRYGNKLKYKKVLDENGNVVDVKTEDTFYKDEFHFDGDPVCYDFNDKTSTEWKDKFNRRPQNWQRLNDVYDWANIKIATKGHVFLNEVLYELGLPLCPAGQILGWRRRFSNDPEERFRCPDLSFGLEDIKNMLGVDGNPISGFDLQHLDSYPLVFNCIDIAHNTKMWERDRPYSSLCSARIKSHAW